MSVNNSEEKKDKNETGHFLKLSEEQRLFFAKRKVFARMNKIIGGVPVQQGKLKRIDLTKEEFEWKNGKYAIPYEAPYKIEKVKWPQKQRIIIEYDVNKAMPQTYEKRNWNKDALWFAGVLKKGTTRSVIHSDQTMKLIALVAMLMAFVAMGAAMYAWTNPEEVLELKQRGKAKATPTGAELDLNLPANLEGA